MPTYKVPADKGLGAPSTDEKHQPYIYIPVSEEIMKVFAIGQEAEVTLMGTVKGMTVND